MSYSVTQECVPTYANISLVINNTIIILSMSDMNFMEHKTATNHQKVFEYLTFLYTSTNVFTRLFLQLLIFIFISLLVYEQRCVRSESINNASIIVNIYRNKRNNYTICAYNLSLGECIIYRAHEFVAFYHISLLYTPSYR